MEETIQKLGSSSATDAAEQDQLTQHYSYWIKPILGYWDIRGLGQPIRMMLAYANLDYEEEKFETSQDPASRSSWLDEKFKRGMPFPNLPHFVDKNENGELFVVTEHNAIMYYIADRYCHELLGATPEERATTDMLLGVVLDFRFATTMELYTNPNPDLEKLKNAAFEKASFFSDYLRNKDFSLGNKLSYADFSIYEVLNYADFLCGKPFFERYWDLLDYVKRIEALPQLQSFFAEHGIEGKEPFNLKFAALVNYPEVNYNPTRNID